MARPGCADRRERRLHGHLLQSRPRQVTLCHPRMVRSGRRLPRANDPALHAGPDHPDRASALSLGPLARSGRLRYPRPDDAPAFSLQAWRRTHRLRRPQSRSLRRDAPDVAAIRTSTIERSPSGTGSSTAEGVTNPTATIAAERFANHNTVAGWLRGARERGYLPPGRRGRLI